MFFIEGESFLPGLEKEAFAQFQKKLFNIVDDGGFQVGLGVPLLFRQS